jgi:NAD(P)-dependent dehydrogenase (short-subunit alcohol dehydrogenase family)
LELECKFHSALLLVTTRSNRLTSPLSQDGKEYLDAAAYGQSKTGNVLFSLSLSQKLASKGITAFSLHPGGIMTNLSRNLDWSTFVKMGFVDENLKPINSEALTWKTLPQGASTTVIAAFDPSIAAKSGGYLVDGNVVEVGPLLAAYAFDEGNAEKLWALSEELVGEKFTY